MNLMHDVRATASWPNPYRKRAGRRLANGGHIYDWKTTCGHRCFSLLMATSGMFDRAMAKDKGPRISGRRRELRTLAGLLESSRPEFLALYGRRRVGKTFLVRQFFSDRARMFEVTGRHNGTMADNLRVFAEALSDSFHGGAGAAVPATWHDAFRALRRELERRRRSRKKVVLFFDELPWLATHKSGCLEELEHFWNSWCSKQPTIVLIVCGSAASWMLKHVVHAHGGLHNRLTETIRLLPFSLAEAHTLLADRGIRITRHQAVELYMALGGVPHYLEKVPRGASMAQAIDALCFAPAGPLAHEFDHLFASLFAADDIYLRIVRELAKGRYGLSRQDLLRKVGIASGGGANRILSNLEEAGFIQTTIPFGRTSRDRFYRLVDEFSLFHQSWLAGRNRRKGGDWLATRGSPRWTAWSGLAFESLCLKHVDAIERALGISGVRTEASSWQHRARTRSARGAQIDLLIDRADDLISVCELKHTVNPFAITKRYAQALRNKLAVFQQQTGTRKGLQLVLIATAGLVDNAYARDVVDHRVDLDAFWS